MTATAPDVTTHAELSAMSWYHTVELPDGYATPGWVDCRPIADRVLIPQDLSGLRVLDVGTWDGFWAFELERRGGEVVTVDIEDPELWDWPPRMRMGTADEARRDVVATTQLGVGFARVHELLGSTVQSERLSVYDLSPDRLGTFDLVVVGSILLHLRDPVAALDAIRSVASGPVILNEAIELLPTIMSPRQPRARLEGVEAVRWWQPNLRTVELMASSAGLDVTHRTRPFFVPLGEGHPRPARRRQPKSLLTAEGREHVITWNFGIPHVSIQTRPRA